jgi:hypothetical protein
MALTVGYLSMLLLIRCTVLTVRYAYPVSHDYILTFFPLGHIPIIIGSTRKLGHPI